MTDTQPGDPLLCLHHIENNLMSSAWRLVAPFRSDRSQLELLSRRTPVITRWIENGQSTVVIHGATYAEAKLKLIQLSLMVTAPKSGMSSDVNPERHMYRSMSW